MNNGIGIPFRLPREIIELKQQPGVLTQLQNRVGEFESLPAEPDRLDVFAVNGIPVVKTGLFPLTRKGNPH
jgi:hypothetical protein